MSSNYSYKDTEIEEFLKSFDTVPFSKEVRDDESDSEYCLISLPRNVSLEMFNNVKVSMSANSDTTQISDFKCEFEELAKSCLLPQLILSPLVQQDSDETVFLSSSLKCKLKCAKIVSSCFEDKRAFLNRPSVPPLPKSAKQRSVPFGSCSDYNLSHCKKYNFINCSDDYLNEGKNLENQHSGISSVTSKSNKFANNVDLQKKCQEDSRNVPMSIKKAKKKKRKLYAASENITPADVLEDVDNDLVRRHKSKRHKLSVDVIDEIAFKKKKTKKKRKHSDENVIEEQKSKKKKREHGDDNAINEKKAKKKKRKHNDSIGGVENFD